MNSWHKNNTESPVEHIENVSNYESAIQEAKFTLANLAQSIKEAMAERDALISSNNTILREKLDELQSREITIEKRRTQAEELHASANEKHSTVNNLTNGLVADREDLNKKKSELAKDFQEQVNILDTREHELNDMENNLNEREKKLQEASVDLDKKIELHENHISVLGQHSLDLSEKSKELDKKSQELHDGFNNLAAQKLEIFNLVKEHKLILSRVEDIKKDIDLKVKEQADLLDINNKKEQSIRDLIIEERRSKIELDKSIEVQRKASNIMQQQKKELEDLRNEIVNHKPSQEEV